MEHVVLVDPQDNELGTMEKLAAHRQARLHRAISVVVFNSAGEMLLQRRAPHKYHSGGLWANTCCTHPRPGETCLAAAARRLPEEMGFTADLEFSHRFVYRAELDHGLTEHELDHVYRGCYDGPVRPNPGDADAHRWVNCTDLAAEMAASPDTFAPWFRIIFQEIRSREQV